MGNGESTSRHISMQRSDEGAVQISEDVILRLKGKSADEDLFKLSPGETIIHEEDLKLMLEKALYEGRKREHDKFQQEKHTILKEKEDLSRTLKLEQQRSQEIDSQWKKQLEQKENFVTLIETQAQQQQEEQNQKRAELESLLKVRSDEKDMLFPEMKTKNDNSDLIEERKLFEDQLVNCEKQLHDEFNSGVEDIEKKIKPMQQAAICKDFQSKVLDCYRQNKKQPLKCSQEVKDFVQCVQATRVKLIQKNLTSSTS